MQVVVHPREPGTRRVRYIFTAHHWALPLAVGIHTSFFPTETSGMNLDQWDAQHILVVRVLAWRLEAVLRGPLFAEEEAD